MGRIFNMDNKFFTFMSRVADLIILNVVFIVCCIPIVTIGASVTAMNYVTMKMARNEESYIVKSFFKSFRENFKQATIIWLILLVAGLLLGMDFRIVQQVESTGLLKVVTYGLYMVALIYAMVLSYIFPLLAKFDNTIKNTFKNAMLMSIRHLPFTIVILLVGFAPAIATLTIPIVLAYGLIVWIMVGFSLIAFLNSLMFVRIFDHYIPQEEDSLMEGSSDSSEH
jgi:uncharacterized membrane protein YesL